MRLSVEEVRQLNAKKNNKALKTLINDHVFKSKVLHAKQHTYYSNAPNPVKYDLKDTFFREKWAQRPEADLNAMKFAQARRQKFTSISKNTSAPKEKPFCLDRGILFLKRLEDDGIPIIISEYDKEVLQIYTS